MGRRGNESLPIDYEIERQFVSDDKIHFATKKMKKNEKFILSGDSSNNQLLNMETTNMSDKIDEYYASKNNREKFNTYLKDQRHKRYEEEKLKKLNEKFDPNMEKLEEKIPIPPFFLTKDIDPDDGKLVHPFDAEFWFGTNTQTLEAPNMKLVEAKDPLFVLKPLGKYVIN